MGKENQTFVTEFIILGFSENLSLHVFISVAVFLIYLNSVLGNLMFLILMCADSHLHKPMYFFLSNLSILDIFYTLDTLLTMVGNFTTNNKSISFFACLTQIYFLMSFISTEFFLLTAMAYDRYAAVCNPLQYARIMSKNACILLAALCWILGFLNGIVPSIFLSKLYFCGPNEINHYFCDPSALMKLSCNDPHNMDIVNLIVGLIAGFVPFVLTMSSYISIICTILRMRSAEGRHKAFSTCSSHLSAVIIFYGTIMCVYMRPTSMHSLDQDKLLSLLYTAVIPMLNPIIYSLRNKDIKNALKNAKRGIFFPP